MADTARIKSALAALFADNTAGAISPQDLRDFLETMHPSFGGLYFSTPAATTCTLAGTFYKAAGTTTVTAVNRCSHTDNRITYTGDPSIHMHIAASMSFTTSGTNDIISVCISKNGTPQTGSEARRKVGTGTDVGSTALHWDVMMSTNDYLEVWVSNEDSAGTTVTLQNCYLFGLGMMV